MAKARILVVEDEGIVAQYIKNTLEGMGYDVPALAFTGQEAIDKAEQTRPDLVLMDIILKGDMDGIDAAEQIRSRFGIPSIYLTAYADEEILQRAKITESYGYILKPYVDRELRSNIEIALYRIETEKELKLMADMLSQATDGILIHDLHGNFIYANDTALKERGYSREEFLKMNVQDLVSAEHYKVLKKWWGTIENSKHQTEEIELRRKDGSWFPAEVTITKVESGGRNCVLSITRNITERKKAEEALKESERRYGLAVKAGNVGVWDIDLKTNEIYIDPYLKEMLGYKDHEIENNLEDWVKHIYPEDSEITMKKFQDHLDGKTTKYNCEHRMVHKDGSLRWFAAWGKAIFDDSGKPLRVIGTDSDITERKKAEEELKESEEKYRILTENMSDIVYSLDRNGILTYISPQTKQYGIAPETLISRNLLEIVHPEDRENVAKEYQRSLERGEEFPSIFRVLDARGGVYWFEDIGKIQRDKDGNVTGIAGVLRDVTERKKADEALKQSENNLKTYLEHAPDGVYIVDLKGTFLYGNRKAEEIIGYKREEILGKSFLKVKFLPASYLPKLSKLLALNVLGKPTGPDEYELIRKDGSRVWVEVSTVHFNQQGEKVILGFARDITERKKAEEAQKESENRFRTMFDSMGDGVCIYKTINDGEDFIFVDFNKAAEKIEDIKREDIIGKSVIQTFPGVKECGLFDVFRRVWTTGETEQHPINLYKDERIIGWRENYVYKLPSGEIVSIFVDVTEREKVAEELKLRTEMLDQSRNGIIVSDTNGNFVYANKVVLEERGYTQEEFLKLNVRDLVVPPDAGSFDEWWQQVVKKGYFRGEYGVRRKDGLLIPVEATITRAKSGEREYIISVVRDITERKKAEEELKLRAEMLDKASDAIMLQEIGGNFTYANETTLEQRGYTLEQFTKLSPYDLALPEYAMEIAEHIRQVVGKGHTSWEQWVQCRDRSLLPVEAIATLVNFREKEYMLIVARDITERKRMEEERAELEWKAQVASRLASVGEMASGLAHEINNPLTGVVGFAQLLAGREDMPQDVREQLKIINEGGQRVSNIIQGLLSFARQSKPKRTYIDINEIVERTIRLQQYQLGTSNIELIMRFDPELPWTMADAGQLQQVFINLVVNAEQEMSKAHGKGRLEIKTELAGEKIRITFKDDGPGIAKENIGRIFDPFFTTKEVGKGTGLGLSLSHGIIVEHEGELMQRVSQGREPF